jgi:DNA-binding protein HU-beta/integration host factor subunit alpha
VENRHKPLQINRFLAGQTRFGGYSIRAQTELSHCFSLLMATITKRELAIKITDRLGAKGIELTQQDVLEVVQTLIDEVTESLAQGDTVVMRNFGAFQVREMKAKIGRNPKDPAKDVPIPARAAVKFKPGKEMKEKVASTLQVIRERKP